MSDAVAEVGRIVARVAERMGLMSEDEFMRHYRRGSGPSQNGADRPGVPAAPAIPADAWPSPGYLTPEPDPIGPEHRTGE